VSKDPDFALKLEAAIVEKYGPETVVHPKKNWNLEKEKKYLEDLKSFYKDYEHVDRIEHNGFLISKKLFSNSYSKICLSCGNYCPSIRDRMHFIKFNCCFKCHLNNVEGRN
jgi:hypothetical protein